MTDINPGIYSVLNKFRLPDKTGFGKVIVPIMYRADYRDGCWRTGRLIPYADIAIDPAAKILHYGQSIFEGMKAYKVHQDRPSLFRPMDNWRRMNRSAQRLCMPELPEVLFIDGISYITAYSEKFIPTHSNQSLYLRPFMISTGADLSLQNSTEYSFIVIASPSEAYHSGAMKILIQRESCRAAIGGTGKVKAGGNYASALQASARAETAGYHQCLWLDPKQQKYIEELSGMNVFAVVNGQLYTPELTDSMLAGITRDSLITLARSLDYEVVEKPVAIDELINLISSGECTEMFACGTAAIITSISTLGDLDGKHYSLNQHYRVAEELRTVLLNIQEGKIVDNFDWLWSLPLTYYPELN